MKIQLFSAKPYEKPFFDNANKQSHYELSYSDYHLSLSTCAVASGADVVCCFVNDALNADVLTELHRLGVKLIALRSAGYNHVDLAAAKRLNLPVVRVPAYSPYAVAEHAVGLIIALDRKIHRAYNRVRENDFSLHGLMGFDLHGKTVGVIGTGNIGQKFCQIMHGFGCQILAFDPEPSNHIAIAEYVSLEQLFKESHIISLHCPLTPETLHMIDAKAVASMRNGVMLINTSRGATIDTKAVIDGLKSQKIGYLGLDVYEEEGDLFFEDLSDKVIKDDTFARLQTFPNVIITGHQAFFTQEAMANIAQVTIDNIANWSAGKTKNQVE